MSSLTVGYGFIPAYHSGGGVIRTEALPAGTLAATYATAIYKYDPVNLNDGALEQAAAAARIMGVFAGVEYTDANGRHYSAYWPGAVSGATDIVAYVWRDLDIVYKALTSGTIAADDLGEVADHIVVAGSTVTGISKSWLNTPAAATSNGFQIVGLVPNVDNAWADTKAEVYVKIAEPQMAITQLATGA